MTQPSAIDDEQLGVARVRCHWRSARRSWRDRVESRDRIEQLARGRLGPLQASTDRRRAPPARATAYPCRLDRSRGTGRPCRRARHPRCASDGAARLCSRRRRPTWDTRSPPRRSRCSARPRRVPPGRCRERAEQRLRQPNGPRGWWPAPARDLRTRCRPASASGVGPRSDALLISTSRPPSSPRICSAIGWMSSFARDVADDAVRARMLGGDLRDPLAIAARRTPRGRRCSCTSSRRGRGRVPRCRRLPRPATLWKWTVAMFPEDPRLYK